ncbi:MAG: hypothetical protein ACQSGP_11875 [Frankia sp.]
MATVDLPTGLLGLIAFGALLVALRWTFSSGAGSRGAASDHGPTHRGRLGGRWRRAGDRGRGRRAGYGLLVPVTTVPREADALLLRGTLRRHGIRSTAAPMPAGPLRVSADGRVLGQDPGGWRVLVFPEDVATARRVVAAPRNEAGPAT